MRNQNDLSIRRSFAFKLSELRKKSGLNQIQLAAKLGISRASMSYYENADRIPDALILRRIAEFFCVSTDWLVGLSEDSKQDLAKVKDTQKTAPAFKVIHGESVVTIAKVLNICKQISDIARDIKKDDIAVLEDFSSFYESFCENTPKQLRKQADNRRTTTEE